jgi:hypothetical protein
MGIIPLFLNLWLPPYSLIRLHTKIPNFDENPFYFAPNISLITPATKQPKPC